MHNDTLTRRALLTTLALAVLGDTAARRAFGKDAEQLKVTDPKAVSLGYVTDASRVDTKKYPSYVAGSNCENCMLLQGKAGDPYRPCNLFPGRLVAVKGWCSGWAAEM